MKNKIKVIVGIFVVLFCIIFILFAAYNVAYCVEEYHPVTVLRKMNDIDNFTYIIVFEYNGNEICKNVSKEKFNSLSKNDSLFFLIKRYKITNKIFYKELIKK